MNISIIQQRIEHYQCRTALEEENAIKEITQEIALMALARAGFFRVAEFHGGTALRILHGLPRFSEDLDFALLHTGKNFTWQGYFAAVNEALQTYGYAAELHDRSKTNQTVKKAFLKDNSVGKVLVFKYPNILHFKKIKIKFEIDTNPPCGAESEIKYLDFPLPFSVRSQTLPSSFAGKIHALLCREYMKGRDWFDFTWYVMQRTPVNYNLLSHALKQVGHWHDKKIIVNKKWLLNELTGKIESMNWQQVAEDVRYFLRPNEQKSLEIWNTDFFISLVNKMEDYLK